MQISHALILWSTGSIASVASTEKGPGTTGPVHDNEVQGDVRTGAPLPRRMWISSTLPNSLMLLLLPRALTVCLKTLGDLGGPSSVAFWSFLVFLVLSGVFSLLFIFCKGLQETEFITKEANSTTTQSMGTT